MVPLVVIMFHILYLARALLDPETPLEDNQSKWLTPAKVAEIRAHVNQTIADSGCNEIGPTDFPTASPAWMHC